MASTVSSPVVSEELTGEGSPGSKGLKTGALGMAENVVIGVASTAPAYSLAVSLGLVAAAVGLAVARRSCGWRSSRCSASRWPTTT